MKGSLIKRRSRRVGSWKKGARRSALSGERTSACRQDDGKAGGA